MSLKSVQDKVWKYMEGKILTKYEKNLIQIFLVQINDFVLIKMDTLSL